MTKFEQVQKLYEQMDDTERRVLLSRMLAEHIRQRSYVVTVAAVYRHMIGDFQDAVREQDSESVPVFAAMLLNLSKLAKQLSDVFGLHLMVEDLNRLAAMSGQREMDDLRAVMASLEFDEESEWPDEIEDDKGYTH